ncbi:MAG: 6-phosphofructokinase [Candidatus Omnitrophica bacterium]|nr:6-phosphofructokinase [Candidatus Omnitrophota bacterium]
MVLGVNLRRPLHFWVGSDGVRALEDYDWAEILSTQFKDQIEAASAAPPEQWRIRPSAEPKAGEREGREPVMRRAEVREPLSEAHRQAILAFFDNMGQSLEAGSSSDAVQQFVDFNPSRFHADDVIRVFIEYMEAHRDLAALWQTALDTRLPILLSPNRSDLHHLLRSLSRTLSQLQTSAESRSEARSIIRLKEAIRSGANRLQYLVPNVGQTVADHYGERLDQVSGLLDQGNVQGGLDIVCNIVQGINPYANATATLEDLESVRNGLRGLISVRSEVRGWDERITPELEVWSHTMYEKFGHVLSLDLPQESDLEDFLPALIRHRIVYSATTNNNGNLAYLKEIQEMARKTEASDPILVEVERILTESPDLQAVEKKDAVVKLAYENLINRFVAKLAVAFLPVYEETRGRHGFVSTELPTEIVMAKEGNFDDRVARIIQAGKERFGATQREIEKLIGRKTRNILLKIPATDLGLKAGEELEALGYNVNYTLVATGQQYRATVVAHKRGVMRFVEKFAADFETRNGRKPTSAEIIKAIPQSVSSDFVSRDDRNVAPILEDETFEKIIAHIEAVLAKIDSRKETDRYRRLNELLANYKRLKALSLEVKTYDAEYDRVLDDFRYLRGEGPDRVPNTTRAALAFAQARIGDIWTEEFERDQEWTNFLKENFWDYDLSQDVNDYLSQQIYWASTGVKVGGKYTTESFYLGGLVAKQSTDTVPRAVVAAIVESGKAPFEPRAISEKDKERGRKDLARLEEVGIDLGFIKQAVIFPEGLKEFDGSDRASYDLIGKAYDIAARSEVRAKVDITDKERLFAIDKNTILFGGGGGDAPGINSAYGAFVQIASMAGYKVLGVKKGLYGLRQEGDVKNVLMYTLPERAGRIRFLGSILTKSERYDPFKKQEDPKKEAKRLEELARIIERVYQAKALVLFGGDDHYKLGIQLRRVIAELQKIDEAQRQGKASLQEMKEDEDTTTPEWILDLQHFLWGLAEKLRTRGLDFHAPPIIQMIPKTIDGDIGATQSLGYFTATMVGLWNYTAASLSALTHNKINLAHTMGRDSGNLPHGAGQKYPRRLDLEHRETYAARVLKHYGFWKGLLGWILSFPFIDFVRFMPERYREHLEFLRRSYSEDQDFYFNVQQTWADQLALIRPGIIHLMPEKRASLKSIVDEIDRIYEQILSEEETVAIYGSVFYGDFAYGAAHVMVSEGFVIQKDDPLLPSIFEAYPFLKNEFEKPKKRDAHGNPILADVDVTRFLVAALRVAAKHKDAVQDDYIRIGRNLRGYPPLLYDRQLGRAFARKALELIEVGDNEHVMILPWGLDPWMPNAVTLLHQNEYLAPGATRVPKKTLSERSPHRLRRQGVFWDMTPAEKLLATGTEAIEWDTTENVSPHDVDHAKGQGMTGVSIDPRSLGLYVSSGALDGVIDEFVRAERIDNPEAVLNYLIGYLADGQQGILVKLEPLYKESRGRTGYLSLELDPTLTDWTRDAYRRFISDEHYEQLISLKKRYEEIEYLNPEEAFNLWAEMEELAGYEARLHAKKLAISQAIRFADLGPNVVVKIPATPLGLDILTDLTALGINTTLTYVTHLSTVRDSDDSFRRGLQIGTGRHSRQLRRLVDFVRDLENKDHLIEPEDLAMLNIPPKRSVKSLLEQVPEQDLTDDERENRRIVYRRKHNPRGPLGSVYQPYRLVSSIRFVVGRQDREIKDHPERYSSLAGVQDDPYPLIGTLSALEAARFLKERRESDLGRESFGQTLCLGSLLVSLEGMPWDAYIRMLAGGETMIFRTDLANQFNDHPNVADLEFEPVLFGKPENALGQVVDDAAMISRQMQLYNQFRNSDDAERLSKILLTQMRLDHTVYHKTALELIRDRIQVVRKTFSSTPPDQRQVRPSAEKKTGGRSEVRDEESERVEEGDIEQGIELGRQLEHLSDEGRHARVRAHSQPVSEFEGLLRDLGHAGTEGLVDALDTYLERNHPELIDRRINTADTLASWLSSILHESFTAQDILSMPFDYHMAQQMGVQGSLEGLIARAHEKLAEAAAPKRAPPKKTHKGKKRSEARVDFSGVDITQAQIDEFMHSPVMTEAARLALDGEKSEFPTPEGRLVPRFGFKDDVDGVLSERARENAKAIQQWAAQEHAKGGKVLLHFGIGGQGMSNRVQVEFWGEESSNFVIVVDRLGTSMKELFDELIVKHGYKASEIYLDVSSKSGTTDETLIFYQAAFLELIKRVGREQNKEELAGRLAVKFVDFFKKFNQGKDKDGLFKDIPKEDFERAFTIEERSLLVEVFHHLVFTTSLNSKASRLHAMVLGLKPLIGTVQEFDFSEYTGGRFTENAESSHTTNAWRGLDVSSILNTLKLDYKNYLGEAGNNPEINSALKAAILAHLVDPSIMVVAVRSPNALSEALQKVQLFPEGNGKDNQGFFVVAAVGEEDLNQKVDHIIRETGQAPLVLIVDYKEGHYEGLKPLALAPALAPKVPTIRYEKADISPESNALFALWCQELRFDQ